MDKTIGKQAHQKLVLPVEPYRMNERLSVQQGLFLTHIDISSSFIDNIAGNFDVPADVLDAEERKEVKDVDELHMLRGLGTLIKIVIPISCRKAALSDLGEMNINAATLFPGLSGFARSLHVYLSLFQQSPEML